MTKPLLPELDNDTLNALDALRADAARWSNATEKKPLIVLDPGHGKYYIDYETEKNRLVEDEVTRKKRVGKKWVYYETTVTKSGLQLLKGTAITLPDGSIIPYDGRSYFPPGTYVHNPGTQVTIRHYKGEKLTPPFGEPYTYDGVSDIPRGTWKSAEAPDKKGPSRAFTVSEEDIALAISHKLKSKLEAMGFEVMLTRETMDEILPSRFASRIAKGLDRKVMHLSVHVDYNTDASVAGIRGYHSNDLPQGQHFASIDFADAISDVKPLRWKRDGMIAANLMGDKIPAAIAETGNTQNRADLKRITTVDGQHQTAETLALRIHKYYTDHKFALDMIHAPQNPFDFQRFMVNPVDHTGHRPLLDTFRLPKPPIQRQ